MTEPTPSNQYTDSTQALTIKIPCALATRVERYAKETGLTFTGILIEALDTFLRKAE